MQEYVWPEGAASAVCFSFDVDMISGQLQRFREAGIRSLNELEQRRHGRRVGLPRILDVLERHGVKAAFFVSAHEARIFPDLLPELARKGHEIGMHGVVHEMTHLLSPEEFRENLEISLEVFARQLGQKPAGFRAPAWDLTPDSLRLLREFGVAYDSSLSGFDHPYEIDGITEIPVQWLLDDVVFFRFYGGGVDKWIPIGTRELTGNWLDALEASRRWRELCMLTMHPWVTGRHIRIDILETLLKAALSHADLWVATPGGLAAYHQTSPNKGRFAADSDLPRYPGRETPLP
jgi:peptidoglycan/xylan/chitin deacetylase (PgdA/CDA1 family)